MVTEKIAHIVVSLWCERLDAGSICRPVFSGSLMKMEMRWWEDGDNQTMTRRDFYWSLCPSGWTSIKNTHFWLKYCTLARSKHLKPFLIFSSAALHWKSRFLRCAQGVLWQNVRQKANDSSRVFFNDCGRFSLSCAVTFSTRVDRTLPQSYPNTRFLFFLIHLEEEKRRNQMYKDWSFSEGCLIG